MSGPLRDYTILTRSHIDKYDPSVQAVVSGWQLKVQWGSTATILSVFVPDTVYTPENVDALIRVQGALDEQIGGLGSSSGSSS